MTETTKFTKNEIVNPETLAPALRAALPGVVRGVRFEGFVRRSLSNGRLDPVAKPEMTKSRGVVVDSAVAGEIRTISPAALTPAQIASVNTVLAAHVQTDNSTRQQGVVDDKSEREEMRVFEGVEPDRKIKLLLRHMVKILDEELGP